MPLAAGTRLGPYEITAQIGVGGMGEVYRATDTNLKRAVAIKVLPDAVASDAERLARFQREAEVLASLNHPNIAAIYGLERTETSTALVMELVDGPTLAERTAGGPIPIDDALPLAKQIAEALEAAHEQDIIHRDLKPGNVKVRPDGTLKVLDFGLAKAVEPAGMTATNITQSPTITRPSLLTRAGMLLGTAAYMSPEQARGKAVDQRADIWAFGCVLFEMLTGTRAFEAENIPATLADVITRNPDWSALPPNTPAAIRTLLRRCLEKDPKRRLQAIGDARLELDEALSGASASADSLLIAPMPPSQLRRWLPIAATAVIAALVVGGLMWIWRRPGPLAVVRVNVMPGDGSAVGDATRTPDIAITPDGQRIVYAAGQSTETTQLFVRGLDQLDALPLKGVGDGAYGPFLSPDGEWVGYFAGGAIHKVSITGGPPVMICAANRPLGASWGPNDQMVFSSNAALFRVSAGGGKPELLAAPHISKVEATYGYPEILPGGRAVLFTIVPNASPGDRNQIAVLDLETRRTRVLIRGGSTPRYAPSGHLVYAAAGSLRAVRFDVDRLEMHGNPVPVVEHVATKGLTGAANFGIARSGTTLVYRTGTAVVGLLHTMVWVDRHGHEEPLGLAPRAYVRADLSPDGTKLALDIRDQENDIWVWDLTRRGPLTPLTFDPGLNRGGLWSPDGRKIAFTAVRDAAENLYWQAADGTGTVERLTHSRRAQWPRAFTPDGTQLLFDEAGDMGAVNLTADRRTTRLLQGPHWEANGEISPDGRWLAYESDESQRAEIYVRPFPNVHSGRWKVSTGGGTRPAWARSGRELFYYVPGRLMAVSLQMGTILTFGTPHVVVDGAYVAPIGGRNYVVSPDGQRFLMIKDATPQTSSTAPPPSQLVVVLNWLEELKRLVPTN